MKLLPLNGLLFATLTHSKNEEACRWMGTASVAEGEERKNSSHQDGQSSSITSV